MTMLPFDRFPDRTQVRSNDPDTSKAAAHQLTNPTLVQRRVLLYLEQAYRVRAPGLTDLAILARYVEDYGPTKESSPRKRRGDLVRLGYVEDSGDRRLEEGSRRIVWRITDRGLLALRTTDKEITICGEV